MVDRTHRSGREFKDSVYGELARIGKAASAPKRLELLDLLSQGPGTVEVLADQAGLSVANASQHLQVLRSARLVEAKKKGLYVEYSIADEQVSLFLLAIRRLATSRLAEVSEVTRTFLTDRGAMEEVASDELLRRVRTGEVTVLDVRPVDEYRAGHIPGALSVPMSELKNRLRDLPRRREIVAYCRGPYCVMSIDAVELLRKKGFTAHRMDLGIVDWRAHGFRVARGDEVRP